MASRGVAPIAVTFLMSANPPLAQGQCELQRLDADPPSTAQFGAGLVVDGDTAAVGAPRENEAGVVHVFGRVGNAWVPVQSLKASDPMPTVEFGAALALEGDTLFVAALRWGLPGRSDEQGAVYVFERTQSGWVETQRLTASDGSWHFGSSVAIEGGRAVIGAEGDYSQVDYGGAAYVFELGADEWIEVQKLHPPNPDWRTQFGRAVALSGETIFVGAPRDEADELGSVYVFRHTLAGWVQVQELSEGPLGARFGQSLACDGDRVLVGAHPESVGRAYQGAAHLFEWNGSRWERAASFLESVPGGLFGSSVGLANERLVIGTATECATYLFEHVAGAWGLRSRVESAPTECYGQAVALTDDELWIAYPHDEGHGVTRVLSVTGGIASYCASFGNSFDVAGAVMQYSGSPSVSANDLVLETTGVPCGALGLYYYGPEAMQLPFGEGLRCVGDGGLGVFRLWPPVIANAAGNTRRALDLRQSPFVSGPGEVAPLSTWNFQLVYRDPLGGASGFNLSDALAVTFCP